MIYINTEEGFKTVSLYLQTLDVPEGKELEACKEIIENSLTFPESEVNACILKELKDHFHLKLEQIRNLKKFHKEERKVEKTEKTPFIQLVI